MFYVINLINVSKLTLFQTPKPEFINCDSVSTFTIMVKGESATKRVRYAHIKNYEITNPQEKVFTVADLTPGVTYNITLYYKNNQNFHSPATTTVLTALSGTATQTKCML